MYPHVAHVFIDGGYLRKLAEDRSSHLYDPSYLAKQLIAHPTVQLWAVDVARLPKALLARIHYYDAAPQDNTPHPDLDGYWKAIELQPDVTLGFGALKGE